MTSPSRALGKSHDDRKRLGQFFTGTPLARLLAALAQAPTARTIIDPMVGRGDMLAGCIDVGARPDTLAGIDIDPAAGQQCLERFPQATTLLGSAFDPRVLRCLPLREWDLVITNPPYVRYQTVGRDRPDSVALPDSPTIRRGVFEALESCTALDATDLVLLRELVKGYSGLADIAVPSWILCAGMVSMGGRLAMVVPEAWLSRDYSAVVRYLIARWFEVECVVEDEHAVWFPDALVKTSLVVARRVERRCPRIGETSTASYLRLRVSARAGSADGPIANLFHGVAAKELQFATLAKAHQGNAALIKDLVGAHRVPSETLVADMDPQRSGMKWLRPVGEVGDSRPRAPEGLAAWLQGHRAKLTTLPALGIAVGQGLRTGANGFFYADLVARSDGAVEIRPAPFLYPGTLLIPSSCARAVLRRQSELPVGFSVRAGQLSGIALDLRLWALPEDIVDDHAHHRIMPEPLAQLVRATAQANFGTAVAPKRVFELSAVAPNARTGNPALGLAPRFWYALPDFAGRHLPDLLVPRINSGSPRALLNVDRAALVDANFSTLRVSDAATSATAAAILALLNSSWVQASLELVGSVMGGGALKVEATHLRQLAIPALHRGEWEQLSVIGGKLLNGGDATDEADRVVASALLQRPATGEDLGGLRAIIAEYRTRRQAHGSSFEGTS